MIAKALNDGGASKVYILGRRKDKLDSVAKENKGLIPVQCDITSKESLQSAVDYIAQDAGHINLLVANSGILGPAAIVVPRQSAKEVRKALFEDVSMEDFTNVFHVNTTGNYFTILAFLELLDAGNQAALKGGYGKPLKEGSDVPSIQSQVIVTTSVGAYLRDAWVPPAYAGSKAAAMHLVKHGSTVFAGLGIRVNGLAPGCEFPSSDLTLSSFHSPRVEKNGMKTTFYLLTLDQTSPPRWQMASLLVEIREQRTSTTIISSPRDALVVRRRWAELYCILRAGLGRLTMGLCLSMMGVGWRLRLRLIEVGRRC